MAKSVGHVDWPVPDHVNGEGQNEPSVQWVPYRKEGSVSKGVLERFK